MVFRPRRTARLDNASPRGHPAAVKGPRPKRRRKAPVAVAKAALAVAPLPPQGPREWCETHQCEIDAGAAGHDGCSRVTLQSTRNQTHANWSIYFDEAVGKPRRRMRTFMDGFNALLGGGFVLDAMYLLSGEKGAPLDVPGAFVVGVPVFDGGDPTPSRYACGSGSRAARSPGPSRSSAPTTWCATR